MIYEFDELLGFFLRMIKMIDEERKGWRAGIIASHVSHSFSLFLINKIHMWILFIF